MNIMDLNMQKVTLEGEQVIIRRVVYNKKRSAVVLEVQSLKEFEAERKMLNKVDL